MESYLIFVFFTSKVQAIQKKILMNNNRNKYTESLSNQNPFIFETLRVELSFQFVKTSSTKTSIITKPRANNNFWLTVLPDDVKIDPSLHLHFVQAQKIVEGLQSIIKLPPAKYLTLLKSKQIVISRNLMKRALLDDLKACSSLTDPLFFKNLTVFSYHFYLNLLYSAQPKRGLLKLRWILYHIFMNFLLNKIDDLPTITYLHQKIVLFLQLKQGIYNLIKAELMESYVNVAVVRELLQKMSSEEVTQAEERMRELVNNKDFFSIIFGILSSKQQQEWTRTMAASFLNHQFSSTINDQNSAVIFQAIIQILAHPQIKDLDKRVMEKSIIKCLEVLTQEQNNRWLTFIDSCLSNGNFIDTAFLIIACIAVADIPTTLIEKVITKNYNLILTRVPVKIQNANLVNQMLKMWIVIIDKLNQEKSMRNFLENMISSPNLFQVINSIYLLGSYENTVLCVQSGLAELNFLKYEAAELNKRMLEIEAAQSGEALPRILDFTRPYLLKFAATLKTIAAQRNLIQTTNSDDLVTTLVSIIRLYLTIKPDQFSLEDSISFQNVIIFPFLAVDDVQMDRFQENPEDFNSLAEDCCDKQTFGILKTQAAKLLETLGDKIEGSLQYAINRAVESINIKFGYASTYVFKDLQVLEFETSIMVLSIFSYGLNKFPAQTQAIQKILLDQRALTLPPLELARVFTFLAYNYFQVFKEPALGQRWLNLAITYKVHPTTRYCAFDCFSNIVEDYFNEGFLGKICDQIESGNLGLVWDIVSKLIQKHYSSLSNNAFSLIASKLFTRIKKQIQLIQNKQKNDSLDILNCLRTFVNILKQAKKDKNGNQQRKDYIISVIWPILDFYQEALDYNVQDEVVKVAIDIVNLMNILPPEIYKYVDQFIFVFKDTNSSYSEKIYFKFFNQFLTKANFERNQVQIIKVLVILKDSVLHSLTKLTQKTISRTKKDYKIKPLQNYRLALCNALVVIQNAIAYFGTHLIASGNKEFFEEISSLCARVLPQSSQEQIQRTPSGYILIARTLNTLFLCHMHLKIDTIYEYLKLLQSEKIYHGYDTKVIVMCIAKQIFQQNDISAIVFLINAVSKFIELSEAKDELLDKNKKKKKNAGKINTQLKKIEDFDKIIGNIDSPFKNEKDVFEIVTELFANMKVGNANTFNKIMSALPAQAFNYFNKYIDFEHLEKKRRVIRKVVGIKIGNTVTNPIETQETHNDSEKMNEGSDQDEQDLGFKRKRNKMKAEGKNKKLIKLEMKRQHVQDEQA